MRWFFTWSAALPVKLLLLAWLLYAAVVAALGALVKIGAAATVSVAILGVLATVLVFPVLLALIVGAMVAYAAPLFLVPRLWRTPRAMGANFGLTVAVVVGTALGGLVLNAVAVRSIGWIADREPCAAFRAGVTGSVRPSDECLRGSQSSSSPRSSVGPSGVGLVIGPSLETGIPLEEGLTCPCLWEHPSVNRPSFIRCDEARVAAAAHLEGLLGTRTLSTTREAPTLLLQKIQAALLASRHTRLEIKHVLRA